MSSRILETAEGEGEAFKWEHVVLRLVPGGSPSMFSVPHMVFGDNVVADVRVSSSLGVQILRDSS